MRYAILIAGVLLLAACSANSRPEQGSMFDPACMPDGSVVFRQYSNQTGTFDAAQGSKANCPWNKKK